jgi:putative glutamine amidotransferase
MPPDSAKAAPRIAIPMPHSGDRTYAERAIKQYEEAVRLAGGEPMRIGLDAAREEIEKQIASCDAVLLPGSRADVDPEKYREPRHVKTEEIDATREAVDHLSYAQARAGHLLWPAISERIPRRVSGAAYRVAGQPRGRRRRSPRA